MFRKFIIGAVACLGLMSPLALPAQSEAHESCRTVRRVVYRNGCNVRVYHRSCAPRVVYYHSHYRCR